MSSPRRGTTGSPWVIGLSVFLGTLMTAVGVFQAAAGLVALLRNEVYLGVTYSLFSLDVTTWGWIHVLVGVLVLAAGVAVLMGRRWGPLVGVALTLLSVPAIALFVSHQPIVSLLLIALDVFAIRVLCSPDWTV